MVLSVEGDETNARAADPLGKSLPCRRDELRGFAVGVSTRRRCHGDVMIRLYVQSRRAPPVRPVVG
jgi:hypothetical protein